MTTSPEAGPDESPTTPDGAPTPASSPPTFRRTRMDGALFDQVHLAGARFHLVDLSGSRFSNVYLQHSVISGAVLHDVQISGDLRRLSVNGVDVVPFVEAELDRRHPDRRLMRATDADGLRTAWARLDELWAGTVERARALEARRSGLVHERVAGEWSFVETLRHLVFATDAWVLRALLGDPAPYHPLIVPHDEESENPGLPWDPHARPSLDEALEAWHDRRRRVADVLRDLTDTDLAGRTEPVDAPGYPPPDRYPVRGLLQGVVGEEWEHRLFAERDLDVLERGLDDAPAGPPHGIPAVDAP
ncbi:DinB family protein [Ornithinimicrobium sp. W1665]|uniref:DinB family protein n=1 Tax=Ornithinimicrobium sp. W1665 TaxID=3416666 RepID=UPI003CF08B80